MTLNLLRKYSFKSIIRIGLAFKLNKLFHEGYEVLIVWTNLVKRKCYTLKIQFGRANEV